MLAGRDVPTEAEFRAYQLLLIWRSTQEFLRIIASMRLELQVR